jgi:hypothetical protein
LTCSAKMRSRSSPVSSVMVTWKVTAPVAIRLRYQSGLAGAPPLEAKMYFESSPSSPGG